MASLPKILELELRQHSGPGTRILVVGPSLGALEQWKMDCAGLGPQDQSLQGVEFITADELFNKSRALASLGSTGEIAPADLAWHENLGLLIRALEETKATSDLPLIRGWAAHPDYWAGLLSFLEDLDMAHGADPSALLDVLKILPQNRGTALGLVARSFWNLRHRDYDYPAEPKGFLNNPVHLEAIAGHQKRNRIRRIIWSGFYDFTRPQWLLFRAGQTGGGTPALEIPPFAQDPSLIRRFRPTAWQKSPSGENNLPAETPGEHLAQRAYADPAAFAGQPDPLAERPGAVAMIYGDTPFDLLRKAAAEARRLHREEALPWQDMAFVFRDLSPWEGGLYSLLLEEGMRPAGERIHFHYPAKVPLAKFGPGQVVGLLQRCLEQDLQPALLRELVLHPALDFDAADPDGKDGYRFRGALLRDTQRWSRHHLLAGGLPVDLADPWSFEKETRVERDDPNGYNVLPPPEGNEIRRRFLKALQDLRTSLAGGKLREGVLELHKFLTTWVRAKSPDESTISQSAYKQWPEFLEDLKTLGDALPAGVESTPFRATILCNQVLARRKVLLLEEKGGLAIQDVQYARGRKTRVVFLLGLNEGEWPPRSPTEYVFREEDRELLEPELEKQGMGDLMSLLPKRRQIEEKLLFRAVLETAGERVIMGVSGVDHKGEPTHLGAHGEELLAAACGKSDQAFRQALLTGQVFPALFQNRLPAEVPLPDWFSFIFPPLSPAPPQGLNLPSPGAFAAMTPLRAALETGEQTGDPLSPYTLEQAIDLGNLHLSPSRLKHFLDCPWRGVLYGVFGLEEKRDRGAFSDFENQEKGTLYHQVAETFYGHLENESQPLGSLKESLLLDLMAQSCEDVLSDPQGVSPLFGPARERMIQDALGLARHEYQRFRGQTEEPPVHSIIGVESRFPLEGRMKVAFPATNGEITLSLAGFFDRLEEDAEGKIRIVDIKTGKARKAEEQRKYLALQHVIYPMLYKTCQGSENLPSFSYHFATAAHGFKWVDMPLEEETLIQFGDTLAALQEMLLARLAPPLPDQPKSGIKFNHLCAGCPVLGLCHGPTRPVQERSPEVLFHPLIQTFHERRRVYMTGKEVSP